MGRRFAAVMLLASVVLAGCVPAAAAEELPTEVTISFRYSRFVPAAIAVPAGVPVKFTLRNDDPIAHEWIIGSASVHAAHRVGTEPYHEGRATEISVAPFGSRTTTIIFEPGRYQFICHLPGHEAYGMKGVLLVRAK